MKLLLLSQGITNPWSISPPGCYWAKKKGSLSFFFLLLLYGRLSILSGSGMQDTSIPNKRLHHDSLCYLWGLAGEFTILYHPLLLPSWNVGLGGPDNAASFALKPRQEVQWWSEVWKCSFPAWMLLLVINRHWLERAPELSSQEAPPQWYCLYLFLRMVAWRTPTSENMDICICLSLLLNTI